MNYHVDLIYLNIIKEKIFAKKTYIDLDTGEKYSLVDFQFKGNVPLKLQLALST